MKKNINILIILTFASMVCVSSVLGIKRVPATQNSLDFTGSYLLPIGNSGGFFDEDFDVDLDTDDLYDPSVEFGVRYGQLSQNRFLYNVGFSYIHVNEIDTAFLNASAFSLSMYLINLGVNYYPIGNRNIISPFAGVSLSPGLYVINFKVGESITELNAAVSFNFGFDLKIFESKSKRSFWAVSPSGSYDFWASGDRPKFLSVGLGIKYFYRP
ncbi:MAG: hypothetical protein U9N54_07235 [candidate division Zixibacteria bacterium]|nr:hypothetical protein [candidate division Zixibacteria bacterium]